MVGDGPLRPLVEAQADKRVRVLAPRRDLRRLFTAADLFILTSSREGLSFALLEALAAGLPAVVTDAPENVEAIGQAGLAAPFGEFQHGVDAVADCLKNLAEVRLQHQQRERELETHPPRDQAQLDFPFVVGAQPRESQDYRQAQEPGQAGGDRAQREGGVHPASGAAQVGEHDHACTPAAQLSERRDRGPEGRGGDRHADTTGSRCRVATARRRSSHTLLANSTACPHYRGRPW